MKPRFHILFFIYLIFGGAMIAIFAYIFSFRIGIEAEKDYLFIVENEINDTIALIEDLSPQDMAYPHAGGIKKIVFKNNQEIEVALYLESYDYLDNIKIGDCFMKEKNTRTATIKSLQNEYKIVFEDLSALRHKKGKRELIKWIALYVVLGIVFLYVRIK